MYVWSAIAAVCFGIGFGCGNVTKGTGDYHRGKAAMCAALGGIYDGRCVRAVQVAP